MLLPLCGETNKISEKEYINIFMKNFSGNFDSQIPFKDVLNESVIISNDLFYDRKNQTFKVFRGREKYLNILADTIKNPMEIWNVEIKNDNGHIRKCKRYISIYEVEDKKIGSLIVFDLVDGQWQGTTSFISSDLKYIDKQRKGTIIYQK